MFGSLAWLVGGRRVLEKDTWDQTGDTSQERYVVIEFG